MFFYSSNNFHRWLDAIARAYQLELCINTRSFRSEQNALSDSDQFGTALPYSGSCLSLSGQERWR